ncbi:penicillin-binding transpeptidase domain-containing protein [Streptomyces sp. NPDC049954]|uniref:penicillin-binding transpeptidase domain-containing protein n=1 Tax=Streptomyces sp. NPDC049954 TaxID=3155779 RepID=UPI0034383EEA
MTTTQRTPGRSGRRAPLPLALATTLLLGGCSLLPGDQDEESVDAAAVAAARGFLTDWAAGSYDRAAARTDTPEAAARTLRNFTEGLDITTSRLTAGRASTEKDGARVPFAARLTVRGLGAWSYRSAITVRRAQQEGKEWVVHWELPLVHPRLSDRAKFGLEREETAAPKVLDARGEPLGPGTAPSLPVALSLAPGKGAARGEIRLVDRVTGEKLRVEKHFGPRGTQRKEQRTTLDAALQSVAEKSLAARAEGKNAGLVALRISDGRVLAVANNPATGFNRALLGRYAPGSTMKVLTSAALIEKKAVAPGDSVPCPKYLTVGKQFHNVETSEIPGASFRDDFTHSCNTAFISLRERLADDELTSFASSRFGVGQEWHTGVPTFDGKVPVPGDDTEKAAAVFGQGRTEANPLVMASVTATAVSGRFHQPYVVPGARAKATARTSPLSENTVTQLRTLMRATVTEGTATVLRDLPGDVGAKTGSAEVTEEGEANGWMVAYRGDVAVAVVVEEGGHGSESAGPVTRDLLAAVAD